MDSSFENQIIFLIDMDVKLNWKPNICGAGVCLNKMIQIPTILLFILCQETALVKSWGLLGEQDFLTAEARGKISRKN